MTNSLHNRRQIRFAINYKFKPSHSSGPFSCRRKLFTQHRLTLLYLFCFRRWTSTAGGRFNLQLIDVRRIKWSARNVWLIKSEEKRDGKSRVGLTVCRLLRTGLFVMKSRWCTNIKMVLVSWELSRRVGLMMWMNTVSCIWKREQKSNCCGCVTLKLKSLCVIQTEASSV